MAARFSDEDIQSMLEEGIGPLLAESLRKLQSRVSDMLENTTEFPSLAALDWADGVEASTVRAAQYISEDAEDYRDGAAMVAGRPGEEARAAAAALRDHAAWAFALLAEAQEVLASTRRLRDRQMREVVATENQMIHHAANEFLQFAAKETDGGQVPSGLEAGDAARAQPVDAAATAEGAGARFTERFVALAGKIRRAAASPAYAGEEALVEALRRQAAAVEALCADPDALVPKMLATGSWMLFRAMNGIPFPLEDETQC
ncbi:hypothetical protein ACQJBY_016771 [Aegilops geniculata]